MVEKGGKDYTQLLKEVKSAILGASTNTPHIHSIRSTKEGNLMIIADKNDEKTQELEKILKESLKENRTRQLKNTSTKNKVVHIRGLDATTTVEEVRKALENEIPAGKKQQSKSEI